MAVKSVNEILQSIRTRVGDNSDDDTLSFIEDITDTINDLDTRANNDNENWKKKYEDNDKEWREKYRERFFSKPEPEEQEPELETKATKPMRFEDLFSVKEG